MPPRRPSIDDALSDLKKRAGAPSGSPPRPRPSPASESSRAAGTVDDELAALKRKMAAQPKKK